ncbi:nucleotidyltransferase domain-containing protein [Candidatus Pacearchaeota archaeon]|nr:nucleotidyltransferase domain-containing protein [Candidatus Pacearchaeota archaeon]
MVETINNIKLGIINLFRSSYFNQFHIREMAKLIGKSHVSLLPHLKSFEKDKILTSKEVGKSRVYSLNLENNQVREFLSLSEKKETLNLLNKEFLIKKLYDEFLNLNLNGCSVLFGSYASSTHNKESDIDLLYIGELKESEKKRIKQFGKTYNREIHLTSMNLKKFKEQLSKQGALIKEIVRNHIILYNHDIFINEVWRHYYERKER